MVEGFERRDPTSFVFGLWTKLFAGPEPHSGTRASRQEAEEFTNQALALAVLKLDRIVHAPIAVLPQKKLPRAEPRVTKKVGVRYAWVFFIIIAFIAFQSCVQWFQLGRRSENFLCPLIV